MSEHSEDSTAIGTGADTAGGSSGGSGDCAVPRAGSGLGFSIWDGLVLGGLLLAMSYGIGNYGLYEPHEGHFAGVAREMVLSGDWITPRLDGAPYLNKPPLFYWVIAASYSLLGISELSARLPQALIGWLGVCLAWLWARELWGARAGRAAAGILGISAGWYLFSHQLLIDEMLCVLHLASLYFLWKGISRPEEKWGWIGFYVVLGLSVMAKGLVGPAFPILVLICFAILKRDREPLRRCRPWMGLLIVVAISAPWLTLCELRNPGFLRYVIVNEHWNRLFDRRNPPDYNASKTSWDMFLLIACVWLAPWCFFIPQIAAFGIKNASRWSGIERRNADAVAVLSLGALLPTLLFVPVPSRLLYYSLPTLPPFAVIAAGWWTAMGGARYTRGRQFAGVTAIVSGAAIIVFGQIVGSMLKGYSDLQAAPQTLAAMPGFAICIGGGLIACGVFLLAGLTCCALIALCVPIAIGEALNTKGFEAFDCVRSSKRMVSELLVKRHVGADCIWISEGSLELGSAGGTAFYLGTDESGRARFEYVVDSDSPYRRPPSFPGDKPEYLIDDAKLKEMWASAKPILYVTDFLRTKGRKDDPMKLPPAPYHEVVVDGAGHRRIFANEAAWERLK